MTLRHSLLAFALFATAASAYPPAPHHIVYGTARDDRGRPLGKGSAIIVISTAAGEIVRAPIAPTDEPGVNYTLSLPMDSGTLGTLYRPTALLPTAGFTLRIIRDNVAYVPLELSRVPATIGLPGQRTRLDLTLGVDSDGDGLPDAWEQALIDNDRSGRLRTLADVKPGDDLDGDGLTNFQEYLLGTYALDKVDGLSLAIVEVVDGHARLRFSVISGRSYTIRSSSDLQSWTPQSFSVGTATATPVNALSATDITSLDVWVPLPASGTAFFRLYAQ